MRELPIQSQVWWSLDPDEVLPMCQMILKAVLCYFDSINLLLWQSQQMHSPVKQNCRQKICPTLMGFAPSYPSTTSICCFARRAEGSTFPASPSGITRSLFLKGMSLRAESSSCMQGEGTAQRLLPLVARKLPSLKLILTRSDRNLLLLGLSLLREGIYALRDDIMPASIIVKQMVVIQLTDRIDTNHNIRNEIEDKLANAKYEVMLGHYRITGYINEGQFGKVYKGIDLTNKRPVAVKLIDIDELMRKNKDENLREKLRKYLQTEEILMRKCHSAFVVKLYDVFENEHCKVLVMEYCRHGGLDNYITQRGAVEQEDAVSVLRQIILGLAELHQNNIIHRDLKPANILLHNGLFKIADFGFCKEIQDGQAQMQGTMAGTRTTMAPEVRSSGIYGLKADIWSLGMIYFMMLYPHAPLFQRHNVARDIIVQNRKFDFTSVSGSQITPESSNFLSSVLQINTALRLNWEQVLEHPIFKVKFRRMPSVYLPGLQNIFHNLKEKKPEVQDQQALNLGKQLIDFQKLKEQSQKLVETSRKKNQIQLGWNLDTDILNRQYLQCRISEFLFHSIVTPIRQKQLLNQEDRFHIEFLFLVLSRCRENIIAAKETVSSKYPEQICKHFQLQVEPLETQVRKMFLEQAERLKTSEDRMLQVVHDKVLQLFKKKQFQEKEKFLTLFQRDSFTKEEQIKFTCERYIIQLVNKLKGNRADEQRMRRLLKSYYQINEINLEQLANKHIHQRIDEILEMYD